MKSKTLECGGPADTGTVRVPVNAPSAVTAEAAVEMQLRKDKRDYTKVHAELRAGANKPDDQVAIVVTKPAGLRSTYIVFVTL